jgi:predicted transposase YdaD
MVKRHDPTMRNLFELGPPDWPAYLGFPVADPARVTAVDSNVSAVTAEADKVLWVDDPRPWIIHVEFQAGRDVDLADRAHMYSALLRRHHRVPIRTALVLLRPAADGLELTGLYEQTHHDGEVYDSFRYHVVRVWQQPVAVLLAGGLTVLPLAPVSDVKVEDVPGVLVAISDRLTQETSPDVASTLWNATEILMGLRYSNEQIDSIIAKVTTMIFGIRGIEESSVYQRILRKGEAIGEAKGEAKGEARGEAKGRVEEAREILLRHGRKKLGPASEKVEEEINELGELDRLHTLIDRILEVSTWDELLSPPKAPA